MRFVEPVEAFFRAVGFLKPHIERRNGVWIVVYFGGDPWTVPAMAAKEFVRQYLL